MFKSLKADISIIRERDPAARSSLEILFCYPGLHAICMHRLSHRLWGLGLPLLPRFLSQVARFFTGVEIHPGARIGQGVFIDHGAGVVIGETAVIGDRCLLFQGVTLGGTGKQSGKRHPTLEENVVVGAGAKVLGGITVGANTRIGAGSVLLRDVEHDCTVVGVPGRVIQVIRNLMERIDALENALQQEKRGSEPGGTSQSLRDREIIEFLEGSGI
ncbi:MAG: serine O-acetyltransferase [Synechococcaceae bacterium WB9_3_282]|nr:serine O-acetyltransferase [Synechococcaceae bacterium WB9_3_282]